MRKFTMILASLLLVTALLAGCGNNNAGDNNTGNDTATPNPVQNEPAGEPGNYADGLYYAEADDFGSSGWKYFVALKVEGGKIVDVHWNALPQNGGLDKKNFDKAGKYGMKAKAGAQAEWWEQAEKAEAHLLEVQDPKAFAYNEDGKTDAIAGVSITVSDLPVLAQKALDAGPVEPGPYKDGTYYAEEADFGSSGWKYTATITVVNGNIVAADWNGVHKDGGDDKDTVSASGEYGMVEKGGAQAEWHEQAALAEAFLIEKQDPAAITYTTDQGHTDAIAGVSIHVVEFFELAEKALEGAK